MSKITKETILKFIDNCKKINDMEKSDKTLIHYRIGLKGMNGPYIDFIYTQSKFIGSISMEVKYNGDVIYKPTEEECKDIKQAIENRDNQLKKEQVEKKIEEFIKIVEDL